MVREHLHRLQDQHPSGGGRGSAIVLIELSFLESRKEAASRKVFTERPAA